MMGRKVEVFVDVHAVSATGLLVQRDPNVWVPRSQIDREESDLDPDHCTRGDSGGIVIPEWLATEKGLV